LGLGLGVPATCGIEVGLKKLAARVSGLPVGKNRMILGSLVFTHYETVTDRQTDKPPIPIVPL